MARATEPTLRLSCGSISMMWNSSEEHVTGDIRFFILDRAWIQGKYEDQRVRKVRGTLVYLLSSCRLAQ